MHVGRLNFDHPVIIAHRGFSFDYPENTLLAFQKAMDTGCIFLECDVQLSADYIPVIFHNKNVQRITGVQKKVSELTFEELKAIDAGSWFDEKFADQRIPGLEDLLSLTTNKSFLNIELKSNGVKKSDKILVEKVLSLVKDFGAMDQVIFSSFDNSLMQQVRKLHEKAHIGILQNSWFNIFPEKAITHLSPFSYHCEVKEINPERMAQCKARNLKVFVYTVNDAATAQQLFNMGVNGIFTDNPKLFKGFA